MVPRYNRLSRNTVGSLAVKRKNALREEFKRVVESVDYPSKRFTAEYCNSRAEP